MTLTSELAAAPPQTMRILGDRTHIDIRIAFTATCLHGHQHQLHITDISAWDDAIDQTSAWTNQHLTDCPGT